MKDDFSCTFGCAVCGVSVVSAHVRSGRATAMLKGEATLLMDRSGTALSRALMCRIHSQHLQPRDVAFAVNARNVL